MNPNLKIKTNQNGTFTLVNAAPDGNETIVGTYNSREEADAALASQSGQPNPGNKPQQRDYSRGPTQD